jgi:hypothetical protein
MDGWNEFLEELILEIDDGCIRYTDKSISTRGSDDFFEILNQKQAIFLRNEVEHINGMKLFALLVQEIQSACKYAGAPGYTDWGESYFRAAISYISDEHQVTANNIVTPVMMAVFKKFAESAEEDNDGQFREVNADTWNSKDLADLSDPSSLKERNGLGFQDDLLFFEDDEDEEDYDEDEEDYYEDEEDYDEDEE